MMTADETPVRSNAGGAMDWGVGHYEDTADRLMPAADVAVSARPLQAGERVLDLGCGTGNAALLAAEHGAQVTGVDPAPRLLQVARDRAEAAHRPITFVLGAAESLPLEDASVDVVLSVFAVIFASDPAAAVREIDRVLTADGRLVISAWIPQGPIMEMNAAAADAVRQALGLAPGPQPFAWHDRDASPCAAGALRVHARGSTTQPGVHRLITARLPRRRIPQPSPGGCRAGVLAQVRQAEAVRTRLLQILEAGNEDPRSFRATSRYIVATARGIATVGAERT